MVDAKVTVYGAYWCPDCRRSKRFLGEQFIPYRWVDIEQDKDGEIFVLEKNQGKRIIPTIVFADGSFLVEPSNAEIATKLGLKTEAKKTYYDLIIIGGGPAGLTAAIYAAPEGADTLLIERSGLGGQAGITVGLDNFPGFPEGIGGQEFSERVAEQAKRFGVEILQAVEVEKPEAAFIFIGQMPNTTFVKEYVEMDKYGFILSGHDLVHDDHMHNQRALPFETSVPGIFAAGDARHGSTKQVASAVGEGAAASISIREFLKKMG